MIVSRPRRKIFSMIRMQSSPMHRNPGLLVETLSR
jgi:hypothetical protein